jgi:predicted RNA binding protein YcfA (HicA-like mRNA interferase family)
MRIAVFAGVTIGKTTLKWYRMGEVSMPLSGKEMARLFLKAGWLIRHQKGSHLVVVNPATGRHESIPQHRELAKGTEHKLLKILAGTK